jgi:hypothetical protein
MAQLSMTAHRCDLDVPGSGVSCHWLGPEPVPETGQQRGNRVPNTHRDRLSAPAPMPGSSCPRHRVRSQRCSRDCEPRRSLLPVPASPSSPSRALRDNRCPLRRLVPGAWPLSACVPAPDSRASSTMLIDQQRESIVRFCAGSCSYYQEFAVHYGMGVVPARPYKPRDVFLRFQGLNPAVQPHGQQFFHHWLVQHERGPPSK